MRITLLFTDIEGSTGLLQKAGPFYVEANARHHAIIRKTVAAHDGHEFHETGDGLSNAFDAPLNAVRCAVAIQRRLAAEPWLEQTGPLRVRIAVCTGEAEFRDGQYRGLAMNRAARILAAGHGGQILCCNGTASAVTQELGADVQLRDIGLYLLRGFRDPERLFQVCFVGMPRTNFPPLLAQPANEHNLPATPTQFFGRAKELNQLTALLDPQSAAERVVTMTGPGGMGKTRAAIAAGWHLLEAFSHAITFVPLAELEHPSLLPDTLRRALKVEQEPGKNALDQIIERIADQPWLLILDNFEQLAAEGGELLLTLLRRTPKLRCLVTSRQRLEIPGEREFLLSPLPTPSEREGFEQIGSNESVRLFLNRAQAVRGDFALTENNASDIAALCRMLEGIPLAIELAAPRVQVLSMREILSDLRGHFDALVDTSLARPARHRTLDAAIDWSYQSLLPDTQAVFRQLSVFRGGCNAESAAAVTQLSPNVVRSRVLQLRNASLVTAAESPRGMRYSMLETVRQFAAERLGQDTPETHRRHHDYFSKLAKEVRAALSRAEDSVAAEDIKIEHDNLRHALSEAPDATSRIVMADSLGWHWADRGYVADALRALQWTETEKAALADNVLSMALNTRAALHSFIGDPTSAEADYLEALELCRKLGHQRDVAAVLCNLGNLKGVEGNWQEAQRYQEESVALYRKLDAPGALAQALLNLAATLEDLGELDAAEQSLRESLELCERYHLATSIRSAALFSMATVHAGRNEYLNALRNVIEALTLDIEGDRRRLFARSYYMLGELFRQLDHVHLGARIYYAAEELDAEFKVRRFGSDEQDWQQNIVKFRELLSEEEFATAREESRTLTPERVLTLARSCFTEIDRAFNKPGQ